MARSEYWSGPLRLPTPAAAHVAIASGVSQRVTSPRSPHEGSVVLGPVPDAIRCRVLRMHSRLHIEIMTRRRSRWSTCRPLLAHRAKSAHQRPELRLCNSFQVVFTHQVCIALTSRIYDVAKKHLETTVEALGSQSVYDLDRVVFDNSLIEGVLPPVFLDSGMTVFASTLPRPARRGRVAPGRGFDSRISPASTVRCMSA